MRPIQECSGSPGSPGRSSSRSTSTYFTPASLPICSSTGLGKTSEPKIAGTFVALDLVDERRDLLRRRVLEVRDLDRADDVPAVVAREVRVGVVVGQQLALRARDRGERRAHRRVERVDLRLELVVVGREVVGVGGVALGQVVADDRGVLQRVRRVGPEVRVGLAARTSGTRSRRRTRSRGSTSCRARRSRRRRLRFSSASSFVGSSSLRPLTKRTSSARQQLGDARLGLERVRVRALRDDAGDLHAVAADVRRRCS